MEQQVIAHEPLETLEPSPPADRRDAIAWHMEALEELADALYEQALEGLTETITRDDGRTVTRHRFDSRLSIAVLGRLDRRCDRAAEHGPRHLRAVGRWDEFTAAVGCDDRDAALSILDPGQTAQLGQPSQLRGDNEQPEEAERLWWDSQTNEWRTDFPPPDGFNGLEKGRFGDWQYSRALSDDELDLVERKYGTEDGDRVADQAARNAWFAVLRSELEEEEDDLSNRHPGLDPCPQPRRRAGSTLPPDDTDREVDPGSCAKAMDCRFGDASDIRAFTPLRETEISIAEAGP